MPLPQPLGYMMMRSKSSCVVTVHLQPQVGGHPGDWASCLHSCQQVDPLLLGLYINSSSMAHNQLYCMVEQPASVTIMRHPLITPAPAAQPAEMHQVQIGALFV